jgi:hypothetical protein
VTLSIAEPGVYDLPASAYHRDPVAGGSLSSTGARRILPPACPAMFKYWREHPQPPKNAFDLGHAVHSDVLDAGEPIVVIDADDYKKQATRQAREEAYATGKVPLLPHELEQTKAAADAIRDHPVAGPLFARAGPAEQVLVWRDRLTGVMCRAMLDKQIPGQRLIVADLKTTKSAEPTSVAKSVDNYGYHQQGAFYLDGIRTLGLHGDTEPAFVLVFVEINPPHLITVVQLDPNALMWGDRLNRKAISTYHRCVTTNQWPAYTDGVVSVDLPMWTTRHLEDAWAAGDFDDDSQETAA